MAQFLPDITIEDIERAIRHGFKLLNFGQPLEPQFESDTQDDRCKKMVRQNCIGLLIYHCFLLSDYRTIGDVFWLDLFVHFCVTTPVVLGVSCMLARRPAAWIREALEALATIVLALTIVVVVSASRMPDRDVVLSSISLVVLFAIVVQRLRFNYALIACLVLQLIYSSGLREIETLSVSRLLMSNSVFIGMLILFLVGCYSLEHEERKGYLLALRERFRHRDLEIASLRDALTGVGNRRALDETLQRLTDAADPRRSIAILLLDIDHFKAFNDANGHQQGDTCLKRVAALLAESIPSKDGDVYRFGGEEFLIVLEPSTLSDAVVVAEQVRARVANASIPADSTGTTVVTISIGAAAGQLGAKSSDLLIATADRELYRAKHNGRNQVSPSISECQASLSYPERAAA